MKNELGQVALGNSAEDFSVSYSDMHGLWGRVTVSLTGEGNYERTQREMGGEAHTTRGKVGPEGVRQIVQTLLETQAREQQTP